MQTLSAVFLVALAAAAQLNTVHGGGPSTVQVCNRGLCYGKKEDFKRGSSPSLHKKKRGGGNAVCEDGAGTAECELYAILETALFEKLEAVECVDCPPESMEHPNDTRADTQYNDFETLDDLDLDLRRSWRDEPQKGSCYDENLGYLFDCRLIEVLGDGQILLEDLQSGGAFSAQPSTFHLHKNEKKKHQTHVPNVVVMGEDPTEDFRTNVELNMMGI